MRFNLIDPTHNLLTSRDMFIVHTGLPQQMPNITNHIPELFPHTKLRWQVKVASEQCKPPMTWDGWEGWWQ